MILPRSPSSGLEAVIGQGARRKSHHYSELLTSALPGMLSASLCAVVIYVLVMMAAGRTDWNNILIVAAVLGVIPVIAVSLLVVAGRRSHPFSLALAVTIFATCLSISIIAATRIPVSFLGIGLSLPTTLLGVTVANLAMARSLTRRVGLLDFPDAPDIARRLDGKVPIVTPDTIGPGIRRILIDPQFHHGGTWGPVLTRLYLGGFEIESWASYLEGHSGRVELDGLDLAGVGSRRSEILYCRAERWSQM